MRERYCHGCYGWTDPTLLLPSGSMFIKLTDWHSTEHWNGRVRATNENPPVLEEAPVEADIPTAHSSQTSVVSPPATRLSQSARRRFRRANNTSTGRAIPTSSMPLPRDSPPTEAAPDWSRAGGDFSATSFSRTVEPMPEERVRGPVELSGRVLVPIVSSTPSVRTTRVPVQLSPAAQRERFSRIANARATEVEGIYRGHQDETARRSVQTEWTAVQTGWTSGGPSSPTESTSTSGSSSTFNDHILRYNNTPTRPSYGWGFGEIPRGRRAGGRADVSALERSWGVIPVPDPPDDADAWNTDRFLLSTVPHPSNITHTARHAALLLDAFNTSRTGSVSEPVTSPIQQELLEAALTAILAITRARRVDVAVQTDPLPAPPAPVDVTMRPDSTCIVCFGRLVDTVLMPCWHLVLCAVRTALVRCVAAADAGIGYRQECCVEMKTRARPNAMNCPVCRRVVRKTVGSVLVCVRGCGLLLIMPRAAEDIPQLSRGEVGEVGFGMCIVVIRVIRE